MWHKTEAGTKKSILKFNFSYLQNRLWKKWSWCICTQRVECWCHKKKTQALELVGADIVDETIVHTSDIHVRACAKKKRHSNIFFFWKTEDHEQREVFVTRHCQKFLYKTSGSLLCLHQTRNKHNVFKNVSTSLKILMLFLSKIIKHLAPQAIL